MKKQSVIQMVSLFWLLGLLAVTGAGCGDEGDSGNSDEDTDSSDGTDSSATDDGIEIFSWWTAPGEAEALQALIDVYTTEYPDVTLVNVSAEYSEGSEARAELDARMEANDPPDTFQLGPRDFSKWVEYKGDPDDNRLEPLDSLFDAEGWTSLFPQGVLDVVTYKGHYYSVPVNMHRQNTMFYNSSLISEAEVPTSLDEFFALAETLQADGIVPLALSATGGWTLEIVLYSAMSGSQGAAFHNDFFSGNLDLSDAAVLAKLEMAIDDYITMMSYTNDDADTLGWDQAAKKVYDGEAAMYIHGDWAKGYYMSLGWQPGVDFGAAASPGTDGEFIFNVDSFALCKGAPSRDNALDFLRVVGSAPAQGAFNILKGSTPVNPDVDIAGWDSVAQNTLDDLKTASMLHNVEVHQFSVPGATSDDPAVGLADQLLAMHKGDLTREELVTWIVDNYEAGTTQE